MTLADGREIYLNGSMSSGRGPMVYKWIFLTFFFFNSDISFTQLLN